MPARTPAELLSDASLRPEEDAWTQPVELKGFGFLGERLRTFFFVRAVQVTELQN